MQRIKKLLMGLAALAALAGGGAAIAGATGGASSDPADAPVDGATAARAGAAARTAVGGGQVVSVERSDEGGAAAYEVKVDKAGKVVEVQVDTGYGVTAQQLDDDQPGGQDRGDGDGERADD